MGCIFICDDRDDAPFIDPEVLFFGDSYTAGLQADIGGFRAEMLTPFNGVGIYIDPTGRHHDGLGGSTLTPDMQTRFPAQYPFTPARVVMLQGGTNDIVSGGASTADLVAARLLVLLQQIFATAPNAYVIVDSIPPINAGSDATIASYWRFKISRETAKMRALGFRCFFQHAGGQLTTADLAPGIVEHPLGGGVYGPAGIGTGYAKWAYYKDTWFDTSLAIDPASLTRSVHYRFDSGTVNGANQFTQFTDLSGNARHATPVTATLASRVSGRMGQDAASFATSLYRTAATFTIAQPSTMVLIADSLVATGGPALIDSANAAARNLIQVQAPTGPLPYGQLSMFAGGAVTDSDVWPALVGHMYAFRFNGAASSIHLDGNPRSLVLSPNTQGSQGYTLGGSVAGTVPLLGGRYYEWYVLPFLATEDQLFGLYMSAAIRYGIGPTSLRADTPGGITPW